MATVVFTQAAPFPTAPLREMLGEYFPAFKWQIGEDDNGKPKTMDQWRDRIMIMGRSAETVLWCELTSFPEPLISLSYRHRWYAEIGEPTTDDSSMANQIRFLIASISMIPDDGARCRLLPNGRWLDQEDLAVAAEIVLNSGNMEAISDIGMVIEERNNGASRYDGLCPDDAARLGTADAILATIMHERGLGDLAVGLGMEAPPSFAAEFPQPNSLATMVLLCNTPIEMDWPVFEEAATELDPDGEWQVKPAGAFDGSMEGRTARINISTSAKPLPEYLMVGALARSHELTAEDKQQLSAHRCYQSFSVDLDTRAVPFEDVREVTKMVTLLIGIAARSDALTGLYNAGVGMVLTAQRVRREVGILAQDEIPIRLWTWSAFDSITPDNISISISGMMPFAGYEVEVWNAPGTLEEVGERLSGVLRYLLINGPVINHGDSFGNDSKDRSTRCFFSPSRAQRGDTVKTLQLEFDIAPVVDPLKENRNHLADTATGGRAGALARMQLGHGPYDLLSVVALTKPTVFPSSILEEMLPRAFPDRFWLIRPAQSGRKEPHQITGSSRSGAPPVSVQVSAHGFSLPAELQTPPHRLHLRVVINSSGDSALARALSLVVCSCLIIQLDKDAPFRLSADGNWLGEDDALTGVSVPKHVSDIGDFDRAFGIAPGSCIASHALMPGAFPPCPPGFSEAFMSLTLAPGKNAGRSFAELANAQKTRSTRPQPVRRPAGGFGRKGL